MELASFVVASDGDDVGVKLMDYVVVGVVLVMIPYGLVRLICRVVDLSDCIVHFQRIACYCLDLSFVQIHPRF